MGISKAVLWKAIAAVAMDAAAVKSVAVADVVEAVVVLSTILAIVHLAGIVGSMAWAASFAIQSISRVFRVLSMSISPTQVRSSWINLTTVPLVIILDSLLDCLFTI